MKLLGQEIDQPHRHPEQEPYQTKKAHALGEARSSGGSAEESKEEREEIGQRDQVDERPAARRQGDKVPQVAVQEGQDKSTKNPSHQRQECMPGRRCGVGRRGRGCHWYLFLCLHGGKDKEFSIQSKVVACLWRRLSAYCLDTIKEF
jgi:hypothetical protein